MQMRDITLMLSLLSAISTPRHCFDFHEREGAPPSPPCAVRVLRVIFSQQQGTSAAAARTTRRRKDSA